MIGNSPMITNHGLRVAYPLPLQEAFWQGVKQGVITSGLNHAAHAAFEDGSGDPPKKRITPAEALERFRSGKGGIIDMDISEIDFSNADLTDSFKNGEGKIVYRIRLDGKHKSSFNDGIVHGTILVERVKGNLFRAVYNSNLECRCANYDFEQHDYQPWYSKRNLLTRYANFVHHFDSYNIRYYPHAKPFKIRYNGTFKIK